MACEEAPYLGSICLWPINYAPNGWLFCIGQTLQVSEYQPLYSLIGNQFGGNGPTTFNLPDLRGVVPIGNQYPQNSSEIGKKGGQSQVTLNIAQLPSHTHEAALEDSVAFQGSLTIPVQNGFAIGGTDPAGNYLGSSSATAPIYYNTPSGATLAPVPVSMLAGNAAPVTVQNTGGGQSVPTMPPYITLNYIMRVEPGIYPVRP